MLMKVPPEGITSSPPAVLLPSTGTREGQGPKRSAKIRPTPHIDESTARQWAIAAADSMRNLPERPRQVLIRMLLRAILADGRRVLPTGAVIYVEANRKLHTQLAVQRLAAELLAAAHEMRGHWELGAWNMTEPTVPWQVNIAGNGSFVAV
jgi:hypothetical protein